MFLKKFRLQILALMSICLIFAVAVFYSPAEQVVYADALDDYLAEQAEIQKEVDALKDSLDDAKDELNSYRSDLNDVDLNIAANEEKLEALEKQTAVAQGNLDASNDAIAEAQGELSVQMAAFESRLYETYVNGEVSMLDVIFDASSMEDFITRAYYVERMLLYDANIVDSINVLISDIEVEKLIIEETISDLDALSAVQEEILAELEVDRAAKADLVSASQTEAWAAQAAYDVMQEANEDIEQKIKELQTPAGSYGTGVYSWPLPGYSTISSDYYYRVNPLTGSYEYHTGIDIPAPSGTQIIAADTGVVIVAGWSGGYGYCTVVDHGDGMSTLYAHQSKLGVTVGQTVTKGEVIGYVGTTGNSTGNHLHFEVRINGSHTSPWAYVTKP